MKQLFRRYVAGVSTVFLLAQIVLPGMVFAAPPTFFIDPALTQQASRVALAEQVTLVADPNPLSGDSLEFHMGATVVSVVLTWSTTPDQAYGLLNEQIDALPAVTSTLDLPSRTFTVTNAVPGVPLSAIPTLELVRAPVHFATTPLYIWVAKAAQLRIDQTLILGDALSFVIDGHVVNQAFTGGTKTSFLQSIAAEIQANTNVNASYSGAINTILFDGKIPGNDFPYSNMIITSAGVLPVAVQPNIVPVAQVAEYSLPRNILSGEHIQLNIAGNSVSVNFAGDSTSTLLALQNAINTTLSGTVVASVSSWSTLTVTAATPGVPFSTGSLIMTGSVLHIHEDAPNVVAVAQTDVVAFRTMIPGDIWSGSIEGNSLIVPYTTDSTTTLHAIATSIAWAYTGANVGVNDALGTITITSNTPGVPFVLNAGELRTFVSGVTPVGKWNVVAQKQRESYMLSRPLATGDSVSVQVNGTEFTKAFAVSSDATLASLASDITSSLSSAVTATGVLGGMVITSSVAGTPFVLSPLVVTSTSTLQVVQAPVNPVRQLNTVSFPNTILAGDTFSGTIQGQNFSITVPDSDEINSFVLLKNAIEGAYSGVTVTYNNVLRSLQVLANVAGTPFILSDITVTSIDITPSVIPFTPETRASLSLSVDAEPNDGDTLTIGQCVISFTTSTGSEDYDCADNLATVPVGMGTSTLAALIRGLANVSDISNGLLASSGTDTGAIFTKQWTQSGTNLIDFSEVGTAITLISNTLPIEATAKTAEYSLSRVIVPGDTIDLKLNSYPFTQTFLTSSDATLTNIASAIDATADFSATSSGGLLSITGAIWVDFTPAVMQIVHVADSIQTIAADAGKKAGETIDFVQPLSGQNISVTINGTEVTITGATISSVISAINTDPVLSGIVTATSTGVASVYIESQTPGSFLSISNIAISESVSASQEQLNIVAQAQETDFTLPYALTSGRTISMTLSGVTVSENFQTDEITTLSRLANDISNIWPYAAVATGSTITVVAKVPGAPFSGTAVISGETLSKDLGSSIPNVVAEAQIDSFILARSLVNGETLSATLDGQFVSASDLPSLASAMNALSGVLATASGTVNTLVLTAKTPGTPFIMSDIAIDFSMNTTREVPNVVPQAKIADITIPRDLFPGDSLSLVLEDTSHVPTTVTVSYANGSVETIDAFRAAIDALPSVTATVSGKTITITGEWNVYQYNDFSIPGALSLISNLSVLKTQDPDAPMPQVSQVVFPTALVPGDAIHVTLDGRAIVVPVNSGSTIASIEWALKSDLEASGSVIVSYAGGLMILTGQIVSYVPQSFVVSDLQVINTATISSINHFVAPIQQITSITASGNPIKNLTYQVFINGTEYRHDTNSGSTNDSIVDALATLINNPVSQASLSGITATTGSGLLTIVGDSLGEAFIVSVNLVDIIAPSITVVNNVAETLNTGASSASTFSVDEDGADVYLVLSGSVINSRADILAAIANGQGCIIQSSAIDGTVFNALIPGGLTDGIYAIVAVDITGNVSGVHPTGIVIDNTPPPLTLNVTAGIITNQTSFTLTGITDPFTNVSVTHSGVTFTGISLADGSFSQNLSLDSDATNTVTVTATDSVGNITTRNITIIQDSVLPGVTLSLPSAITSSLLTSFSGSSESGATIMVTNGSHTGIVSVASDGTYSGTIALDANVLNTLTAVATDLAGNTGSTQASILTDTINPLVNILTASGIVIDADVLTVNGTTEPNATLVVTNQNAVVVGTGSADSFGDFALNVDLLQNSSNTLTVTATDTVGNTSSSAITVVEDSTGNMVTIAPYNAITNAVTTTFNGTTKIGSILTFVHSGGLTQTGADVLGTFTFSSLLNVDSVNDFTITSVDQASHIATGTASILQDSIAPSIIVGSSTAPTSLSVLTLSGTTESNASISVSGGSGGLVNGIADASGSFILSVPLSSDSQNNLDITATDLAGNIGTGSVSIIQDSTPLNLVLSASGTIMSNAATFSLSGTTKSGATILVTGTVATGTTADVAGNFGFTFPLITNSTNTFVVTTTDIVGNTVSQTVTVISDTIAPVVSASNTGVTVSGTSYTLTGTTESGAMVYLSGSGSATTTADSSGNFGFPVTFGANQTSTYTITASDALGNTSTGVQVSVTSDMNAPVVSSLVTSGTLNSGIVIGTYSFTTDETANATFYVGTGANVLGTLVWSGSTLGTSHSGTIAGLLPDVTYYVFVRTIDVVSNTVDTAVTGVIFATTPPVIPPVTPPVVISSGGTYGGGVSISYGGGGSYSPYSPNGGATTSGGVTSTGNVSSGSGTTVIIIPTTGTGTTIPTIPSPTKPTRTPNVPKHRPTTPTPSTTTSSGVVIPPSNGVGTGTMNNPVQNVEWDNFGYRIEDLNSPLYTKIPKEIMGQWVRFISAANSTNVRVSPNVKSNLVAALPRNSRVLLVSEQNGWSEIRFDTVSGWVRSEYLRTLNESDIARNDPRLFLADDSTIGYVVPWSETRVSHTLNVRRMGSLSSRVVDVLGPTERIVILDRLSSGWVEIRTKRGIGFVRKEFVK